MPTISIGNIALGGTGKTPFLMMLLEQLSHKSRIAVLTRGYRSKAEKRPVFLRGNQVTYDRCGDEAACVAAAFPDVWFGVGKDRIANAHLALNEGIDLLILEDGLQYRAIARDHEVILLSGKDPLEGDAFFPKGYLRDLPERLGAASLIVMMEPLNGDAVLKIKKWSSAPIFSFKRILHHLPPKGEPVIVASAIARPELFEMMIEEAGVPILKKLRKSDHAPWDFSLVAHFCRQGKMKGAKALLVTSKDGVKMKGWELPLPLIEIAMTLEKGSFHDPWDGFIEQIEQQRREFR